jgi:hypothetical protein
MNDQGTAFVSDSISTHRLNCGAFLALCAKHIYGAIKVARSKQTDGITGSLKGIEHQIYSLARARTLAYCLSVLATICKLNESVAKYVMDRQELLAAYFALKSGFSKGGRITSQLAEIFMKLALLMRRLGPISAILWLNTWLILRWKKLQADTKAWESGAIDGVKSLTRRVSKQLEKDVLPTVKKYRVEKWIKFTETHLSAIVVKMDGSEPRQLSVSRVNGVTTSLCPCLLREEEGILCGRLITLLRDANQIFGLVGLWDWRDPEFFAEYLHLETFKHQLAVEFVELKSLPELSSGLSALQQLHSLVSSGRCLPLTPPPISGTAGRPSKSQVRKKTEHFKRFKGPLDLVGRKSGREVKKSLKQRENDAEEDEEEKEGLCLFVYLKFEFLELDEFEGDDDPAGDDLRDSGGNSYDLFMWTFFEVYFRLP